ncbi:pol polyprotein [Tanacetum coccineum]
MIIAIAALRNLKIHQMDVKTAFLNGDLEEEIYMNQPEGFIAPGQEGKDTSSGYVILCLYVDDMLIVGSNDKMITSTKDMLKSRFDIKDMGLADVILEIKIIRTQNGLVLSQAHYVDKILNTHNAGDSDLTKTPIDTSLHLSKNRGVGVAHLEYSRIIELKAQCIIESLDISVIDNSIRQLLSIGVISIDYVASNDNIADPFMKGLSRELIGALRSPLRELRNELKYVQSGIKMNEISCLKVRHVEHKIWELEAIPHRPKREVDSGLYGTLDNCYQIPLGKLSGPAVQQIWTLYHGKQTANLF